MIKKYRVTLHVDERTQLRQLLSKGKADALAVDAVSAPGFRELTEDVERSGERAREKRRC